MIRKTTLLGALAVWSGVIALSFWKLWEYETKPGTAAPSSLTWPGTSQVTLDRGRPTLVLFLHPHCPCTRATIEELDRLMAHCQGLVTVHVLACKPIGAPVGWERTGTWNHAARIPGVSVHCDEGGEDAVRLGVSTSGTALLFDPDGRLLFQGGLTNTRGHAGDSVGARSVRELLAGRTASTRHAPVYGCALCRPDSSHLESPWEL